MSYNVQRQFVGTGVGEGGGGGGGGGGVVQNRESPDLQILDPRRLAGMQRSPARLKEHPQATDKEIGNLCTQAVQKKTSPIYTLQISYIPGHNC